MYNFDWLPTKALPEVNTMTEPLTLTLPELAERWDLTARQTLEIALRRSLPMYFYFDGLVFDFGDKWHRANGDAEETRQLEAKKERLATVEIDLQRQNLHRRGLLKLTQWEDPLSDEELRSLQVEADTLKEEVDSIAARLEQRKQQRQRSVRNGLLRIAPRALKELAEHEQTKFPQYAYMPGPSAAPLASTEEKAPPPDGKLLALEDGFPLKEWLSPDQLCASLQDVKALEIAATLD